MSTPTIEQIYRHYSVRRYKPDPVPTDTIEAVVAAGQRASTSSNLQTYSVVAVLDAARRERMAQLCGDQRQIREAPVFLAWCADLNRLDRICRMRGYDLISSYVENFLVAAVDAALAMQNAALAAESLGLGMCYIGAIRNQPQHVIKLLELPRLVFPVAGMTLGWPAAEPFVRPRLPLDAVLHWERYDTTGDEEALHAYDQAMVETGIYRGRQVGVPGGEGQREAYGWLEHSARRAAQPGRTHLRQILERQGFDLH
ncbi:MAG: NADPH-dependent oxidoreductase [Anaerolineae bacterium]|nr:NADPH-dependent oxidoreductase [Anaerolineae bacterium]